MRNICFICETIIDNQHKLEMKVFFYLILVLTLMSCIQLTSISLVNTTNEPIKLCCYYNANNYADSVYIDKRDTSLLIFRSAWFHSSKKVRRAYINHMDSLIIQSLSKGLFIEIINLFMNFLSIIMIQPIWLKQELIK